MVPAPSGVRYATVRRSSRAVPLGRLRLAGDHAPTGRIGRPPVWRSAPRSPDPPTLACRLPAPHVQGPDMVLIMGVWDPQPEGVCAGIVARARAASKLLDNAVEH